MFCGESGNNCRGKKKDENIFWCIKGLVAISELQGHDFEKKSLIFNLMAN